MANIKFIAVSRSLSGILDYVTNRKKTVERFISGVNYMAQTAQDEFEAVKKQFRKTDGRSYYHIVQAFAPAKPSLKKIKNSEKKLDEKIDELMKTALETREVIRCI